MSFVCLLNFANETAQFPLFNILNALKSRELQQFVLIRSQIQLLDHLCCHIHRCEGGKDFSAMGCKEVNVMGTIGVIFTKGFEAKSSPTEI